jgi:hypothetical protein
MMIRPASISPAQPNNPKLRTGAPSHSIVRKSSGPVPHHVHRPIAANIAKLPELLHRPQFVIGSLERKLFRRLSYFL